MKVFIKFFFLFGL